MEDQKNQRSGKGKNQGFTRLIPLSLLLGLVLLLIFMGLGPLSKGLGSEPMWFVFYWMVTLVLAFILPAFAIRSFMSARSLHRKRLRELEKELAVAAEDVRSLLDMQKTNSSDSENL